MHRKYLIFIDDAPLDAQWADYFSNFNFEVIYLRDINQLDQLVESIAALIINPKCLANFSLTILQLFERFKLPILILSEQKTEHECIQFLEEGADDFLTKPIHPRELHARIAAISRRVFRCLNNEHEKEVLCFSGWRLLPSSRQLFNASGEEVSLSAGEYDLLYAFVKQPQQILSRDLLIQVTKHCDLSALDRRIDVQISRLRQKIELDAKKPLLIKTIRNGGYLFTATVSIDKNLV